MINKIRTSKVSKIVASYLAIQMIVQVTQPIQLWALTSGPSQPEFNSFTPIGTSDMVNVASGDFSYNIPIMDVGGYPLNLAYDSGITMDQEASWVGLGWNLNVGQIARNVRGLPDDFNGDLVRYENDMKTNTTVGVGLNFSAGIAGIESPLSGNMGISAEYNNYTGITFRPSVGISYRLGAVTGGVDLSSSVADGATVSPYVGLTTKIKGKNFTENYLTTSLGVSFNSRKALESLNLSTSLSVTEMESAWKVKDFLNPNYEYRGTSSASGYISLNNNTFTPTKRAGIDYGNFTFAASFGATVFAIDGQAQINGFGSYQDILQQDKNKLVQAFGYENTEKADRVNGVLDFNREKDKQFNKHTTVLPVTNYTYDLYSIQGQGIHGMFRPFRSQVGHVRDERVIDKGFGSSLGIRLGVGWNFYLGGNFEISPSFTEKGNWIDRNNALGKFIENEDDPNPLDYEHSYFKMIGETRVDTEEDLFNNKLSGYDPMKLQISGSKYNRRINPVFEVKSIDTDGNISYPENIITQQSLKRTRRDLRNQNIIKVTQEEAENDPLIEYRSDPEIKHHTAGIKILNTDGSTYVYGDTAYNLKKVEATFDVSGRSDINCADGTVGFNVNNVPNPFISGNNLIPSGNSSNFSDKYLNRITTPKYAHTYLLTSILSSDYEDVGGDGPTPDDVGAYTLFTYNLFDTDYKWRVPYDATKASYNEGLKSNVNDEKGSYIYGEKELKYISKIETKTHVAIFHLSDREDSRGAKREHVGESETTAGYTKQLDKISLYSKPEYDELGGQASPIKEAYFKYTYDLCKGVPNNPTGNGKLTLKKVFFTYRDSNMGRYTPYIFNYDSFNPSYNLKSYDIWGNYKPVVKEILNYDGNGEVQYEINQAGIEVPMINTSFSDNPSYCNVDGSITTPEFPFVPQNDKKLQDAFASAWTMTSIDLPSGGKLEMNYESDDYKYVQNEKAMQMFKVTGASSGSPDLSKVNNPLLYDFVDKEDHADYIYVKISDSALNITADKFINDYLGDHINKPIQFRFLLNMVFGSNFQYDYVSGYFDINRNLDIQILNNTTTGETFAAIPLKKLEIDGGISGGNRKVNPISKAGWYFGRTYLNREVYSIGGNSTTTDFKEILEDLAGSLEQLVGVFSSPNGKLESKGSAMIFKPEKSWIRLLHPNKAKLGGGLRVKEIKMYDSWDEMTDTNNRRYLQTYGQQYTYETKTGISSGVATFEPNGSKENPFVEPFYNGKPESGGFDRDKLAAPMESNYTEKPLGESFFPSSMVTYSRVITKNLPRTRTENGKTYVVKKGATGKVVNEMYTTKNYPTIVDYTDITSANDQTPPLQNLLGLGVLVLDKKHLTLSQGFTITTNDINGRLKKQQVFAEGNNDPISEVEYKYSVGSDGQLNNNLPVIDADGKVYTNKSIATHYEVVNDFRENNSKLTVPGLSQNLTGFLALIWPTLIGIPLPKYAEHEQILRTATTTKVVHKTAILVEKIARDLGAEVSTKNVAWDAVTGNLLLTETVNEYGNHYYNFNYPAYWFYDGMGLSSQNIGITGTLLGTPDVPQFTFDNQQSVSSLKDIFRNGDELMTRDDQTNLYEKLWVIHVADSYITLMDEDGFIINQECSSHTKSNLDFKIVRSGYRNQQMASMASVTSMVNPIDVDNDGNLNDFSTANFAYDQNSSSDSRVVNASAVSYTDYWKPQKENRLPSFPSVLNILYDQIQNEAVDEQGNELTDEEYITNHKYGFNPYLYNVRGEWRANKSYAYLSGRNSNVDSESSFSIDSEGFFTSFNSFYNNQSSGEWTKNKDNWTFASQVTNYSPYGAELENKDALNRYSSAQYGYDYTLPTAVGSNAEYREIGFDGFEDYKPSDVIIRENFGTAVINNSHFDFKALLGEGSKFDPVERSNAQAHTGKYSMAIPGGSGEVMQNILMNDCGTTVRTIRCPGDSSSTQEEPNSTCFTRRVRVFLKGAPNEDVSYDYDFYVYGLESRECVYSKYLNVNGNQYSNNGGNGTIRLNSNGEAEFIVSGGATGYFGYGSPDDVRWDISFGATSTSNSISISLDDLCDDRGCNNTPGGTN